MNIKNDVEVIINGKQYTISGYESSDYLQRIANHINDRYAEFKLNEGYARLDSEMRNILLAINLTDDFYKAQQSVRDLQKEKEELEKEIFNMKHDMIGMKKQLEKRGKEIALLKETNTETEHEVIRLETELKNAKAENHNILPEIPALQRTGVPRNHSTLPEASASQGAGVPEDHGTLPEASASQGVGAPKGMQASAADGGHGNPVEIIAVPDGKLEDTAADVPEKNQATLVAAAPGTEGPEDVTQQGSAAVSHLPDAGNKKSRRKGRRR